MSFLHDIYIDNNGTISIDRHADWLDWHVPANQYISPDPKYNFPAAISLEDALSADVLPTSVANFLKKISVIYIDRKTIPLFNDIEIPSVGMIHNEFSGYVIRYGDRYYTLDYMRAHLAVCAVCDEIVETNDDIDDDFICDNCKAAMSQCEECGDWVDNDDIITMHNTYGRESRRLLCGDCAGRLGSQCADCEDWHVGQDIIITADNRYICLRCYEENYFHCEHCGCVYHVGDMYGDGDEYLCTNCYAQRGTNTIHAYGYMPKLRFSGSGPHYIGFELEIDRGDNREKCAGAIQEISENVYICDDGSLDDGMEIISHPGTIEFWQANKETIKKIQDTARVYNFTSHDAKTCGLHFHVSRAPFSDAAIMRLIYLQEKFWIKIYKFSRRTLESCNQWARRYADRIPEFREIPEIYENAKSATRYCALNLKNTATIEFRIYRGTLNADTFFASMQLTDNLVKFAIEKNNEEAQTVTWDDIIMRGNYAELLAYKYNGREG